MRVTRIAVIAVAMAVLVAGAGWAQDSKIGALSAAVDGVVKQTAGTWGGTFWVSVTDEAGEALQVFDDLAAIGGPKKAGLSPTAHITIATKMCGSFPTEPPRFACKWINMTVQSVTRESPPTTGLYQVQATLDGSEFDDFYLGKKDVAHPFFIQATVTKMIPNVAGGGLTVHTLAKAQVVVSLPKVSP